MTDRDSRTRTRARTPGEEDYPPSTAVHWRVTDPTLSGIFVDTNAMHEGRKQTNTGPAHAGSRLKLTDALGRRRPKCHPSSRTGENPPYGMIGGIEETSASFEARSAPRSYPTTFGSKADITASLRLFITVVESRMCAVTWAIRQRPVSHPRSSNRACRFPAPGFPTSFIEGHTGSDPTARGICPADDSPSPFDTATSDGSGLQRCCQAYRQSPRPRHPRKRTGSQGPLRRRHYPASTLVRPCPTPDM